MEENIIYQPKRLSLKEAIKHTKNPFIEEPYFKMETKRQTIIAGSSNKLIVDPETGVAEGITLIHKFKEVDTNQFVKIYLAEIKSLFELSKAGLKTFAYVLHCLKINEAEAYINIPELMEYCQYKQSNQAYRGLGELMANKIIAMSKRVNIWYVNPNFIFNGDRVAFIRQYKIKNKKKEPEQLPMFKDE